MDPHTTLRRLMRAVEPVLEDQELRDFSSEVFDSIKDPDSINLEYEVQISLSIGELREIRLALDDARKIWTT